MFITPFGYYHPTPECVGRVIDVGRAVTERAREPGCCVGSSEQVEANSCHRLRIILFQFCVAHLLCCYNDQTFRSSQTLDKYMGFDCKRLSLKVRKRYKTMVRMWYFENDEIMGLEVA